MGVVAALALPATSLAASRVYEGPLSGNTNPNGTITFGANGTLKKNRFVPKRIDDLDAQVQFNCYDAAGHQVSTSVRTDLAPGFFGGQKVNKNGTFQGTSMTPTGLTYTASGRFHKRTANGTLAITQGQKGTNGYCSTGTFADPNISWSAVGIPPACGDSAEARPLCTVPKP